MRRKFITRLIFSVLSLAAIVLCCSIGEKTTIQTATAQLNNNRTKIIIDAGHGGFDGGAQADDGTLEKDINLPIAKKLKIFLELGGYDVIMIRDTDTSVETDADGNISERKVSDMKHRLEVINSNPDALFVSIHLNKFSTSSAKGAQVFYSPNNQRSLLLAKSVQKAFTKYLQQDNEREVKKAGKSIYLLKNAPIPAIIVECGFLSNQVDLNNLKNDVYQTKTAFTVYCGIVEYLQMS